jgi:uncharacterized membrane protein
MMKSEKATNDANARQAAVGLERLIFFSDAVFAIAVTLLALDIRLPVVKEPLTNAELVQALLGMWPKYLGYGLSFFAIGIIWIGHHRKFRHIRRYDSVLLVLNLFLLMAIAFVPFPSSVLIEYGNRAATVFYALVIALTGILSTVLWWYASYRNRLIDSQLGDEQRRGEIWGSLIVSGVFLLSIPLTLIDNTVAKVSWGLVAVAVRFMH